MTVESPLQTLVRVWRGDRTSSQAVASGDLVVHGPAQLRRALPEWFLRSPYAAVPRAVPALT